MLSEVNFSKPHLEIQKVSPTLVSQIPALHLGITPTSFEPAWQDTKSAL